MRKIRRGIIWFVLCLAGVGQTQTKLSESDQALVENALGPIRLVETEKQDKRNGLVAAYRTGIEQQIAQSKQKKDFETALAWQQEIERWNKGVAKPMNLKDGTIPLKVRKARHALDKRLEANEHAFQPKIEKAVKEAQTLLKIVHDKLGGAGNFAGAVEVKQIAANLGSAPKVQEEPNTDRPPSTVEPERPGLPNLLKNGDNEEDMKDNTIPEWTMVGPQTWTQRGIDPKPPSGSSYFFPGNNESSELQQTVPVRQFGRYIAEGLTFELSAYQCGFTSADKGKLELAFLNAAGEVVGKKESELYTSTKKWKLIRLKEIAPRNTVAVRVSLKAVRANGSNNDAYFDDVRLHAIPPR